MGDFGADTLRDSIESAWALTGRLLKVGSETDAMKEPVFFFAHPQIPAAGEWTKAVEVRKINTDEQENIISRSSSLRNFGRPCLTPCLKT